MSSKCVYDFPGHKSIFQSIFHSRVTLLNTVIPWLIVSCESTIFVLNLLHTLTLLALLCIVGCTADAPEAAADADTTATPDTLVQDTLVYDADLAAALGADDYGMRNYVIAFLKAGPNRDQDSATARQLQQAHMANIRRLGQQGVLVLAGPFRDDGDLRGIYVFDVETVEEARALTATDPAIQAGRLEMELHPWYGSAALRQVNQVHGRIARENP
jgi:uncharacterized protein YciI